MSSAHYIYIPWTGVGLHMGFRSQSWYVHRAEIFKRFTLKSLANQTNKNFMLICSFRAEEKNNTVTWEIAKAIEEAGLKYVFTFDGLWYVDDKYLRYNLKTKARNFLMMLWDCWVYKQWKNPLEILKHTFENKNETLPARLAKSLDVVKILTGDNYDWVYLTRIDSDDMFHREAVNLIQSHPPAYKKALVFDHGFIYNIITGQLATWEPPTNAPFHTIIFPGSTFFDPQKHKEYYGSFTSHEDIPKVFNAETLDMYKYMVSFHGKHISTGWDSDVLRKANHVLKYGKAEPFRGEEIQGYCYTTSGQNISTHWQSRLRKQKNFMIGKLFDGITKEQILKDFGL